MKFLLHSFVFSCLFLILNDLEAQRGGQRPQLPSGKGAIAGMVLDGQTDEAIPFANALLYKEGDSVLVAGKTTNERGRFFFRPLDYGRYEVRIASLGYEEKVIADIEIGEDQRFARLGGVSLFQGASELSEVEVTAERDLIQFGLDKKVFNVEKNISSTGGSAEDVMRNIPSVTVDMDGNISLRGSQNVRILVNGKPSSLTGLDRQAVLQQIPANTIQAVEVMTNPSAKFAPDGMAGIINIVTKRQNRQGFNLKASGNAGTGDKKDGSLNLNYRIGKFNVFGSYSGRHSNRGFGGTRDRVSIFSDTMWSQNSVIKSDRIRDSHNFKGGLEYFLNPKATITGSMTYSLRDGDRNSIQDIDFFDENGLLTQHSGLFEEGPSDQNSLEFDFEFNQDFKKKGQKLSLSGRYSTSDSDRSEKTVETFTKVDGVFIREEQRSESSANSNDFLLLQADYEHPLGKKYKFETGWKSTLREVDNDFILENFEEATGHFAPNDLYSNRFLYQEDIHALYGIISGKLKKWNFQFGLRAEQAFTTPELLDTGERFENDYFNVFPSGFLSYKLGEEQSVQVSYSRRINRPRYRSLNPATSFSDGTNLRTGNPALRPEFINSYEINFIKSWKKGTYNAGLYFRDLNDVITRFVDTLGDIRISTWKNLLGGKSYGIEMIGTYRPFPWWRITANGNFYRSVLDGSNLESDLSNDGILFSGRMMSMWTIWKSLEVQLSGFYRSSGVTVQGKMKSMYSIDFGMKKKVFKGKGALTFRVSDIFKTRRFRIDIDQPELQLHLNMARESRIAYLGFQYSLRQERRKGRYRRNGNQRRGEGGNGDIEMDF